MTNIAVFCVNYHTYGFLADYLRSLDASCGAASNVGCTVFVVDNSNKAQAIGYKPSHFQLEVISSENLGYFPSISRAMSGKDLSRFDYVILSNVDMLYRKDTIAQLAALVNSNKTGWIATEIFSKGLKCDLNPQAIHRYPKRKLELLRFMFKHHWLHFLYTKTLHRARQSAKNHDAGTIYAGHGSFIVLTRSYFQQCGKINYPVFLYDEELYLAEKCREAGLTVAYHPEIGVDDIGKASTGKMKSRDYYRYNYEGLSYILRTYYLR